MAAGLSWRDKLSALLGALSGYGLGRWLTKETRPSCDAPQILRMLDEPENATKIGRSLMRHAINDNFILIDGKALTVMSEYDRLLAAFATDADQIRSAAISSCLPRTKNISDQLSSKSYVPTKSDLVTVEYCFYLMWSARKNAQDAIPIFQGFATKATIEDYMARLLKGEGQTKLPPSLTFAWVVAALAFTLGGLVVVCIVLVGVSVIAELIPKIRLPKPKEETPES